MKNKVLVTGSQGYIGSLLVPKLVKKGFQVVCYDTGFFRDSLLYSIDEHSTIKGDMRYFPNEILNEVETVIHLASIANDPFGNLEYDKIYSPITEYSLSLAEECKKRKIRFIWPSSCSVYGIGDGLLSETSELNPQTPYSQNKVDFEEELEALCDKNFTPIVLRLCTLYGLSPRIRFDLVVNMFSGMGFTKKEIILNSDGKSWRPLVHIDDVCQALIKCIGKELLIKKHKEVSKPLIINVGSSKENYQIRELARIASELIGECRVSFLADKPTSSASSKFKDQNIKDGVDVRTYKVSFDKILEFIPTFKPNYDIKKGISQMINKFEEINLSFEEFSSYKYYRLKTMDYLFNDGKINEELNWNNNEI